MAEVAEVLGRPRLVIRLRNLARQFQERQGVPASETLTTIQSVDVLHLEFNPTGSSKDVMATYTTFVAIMSMQQYRNACSVDERGQACSAYDFLWLGRDLDG